MKIMLINHYAGSPDLGMEYRPFYLACEWQKMGHDVIIIAASKTHMRIRNIEFPSDSQEETIAEVNYLWINTPEYVGNGLARVKNIRAFVNYLNKNAKSLAEKYTPDVVIASSTYPLDNYPAHKIAKLSNAKYFYEVHDLWPLSPKELGNMSSWHPFILWMQRAENYAYKNVAGVISMLPKTKQHMQSHGLNLQKWNYIPNGFLMQDWEDVEPLDVNVINRLNSIRVKYPRMIGYAGTIGLANAMDDFLIAASKMQDRGLAFVLVGAGNEKMKLVKLKEKLQLRNVFFIDPIPKTQIPALLVNFDFLYIGFKKHSLYRFGVSPNKLIDYLMSARPIILGLEAGNNVVAEAKCGIAIAPENSDDLVAACEKLLTLPEDELNIMGVNGRNYALRNHDYQVLAKKFILALEK